MGIIATRDGGKREGRAKRFGINADDYIPVPESGCWLWVRAIGSHGYGKVGKLYAHRISYEFYREPIPLNMQIDHLCRVRCCINPNHLEVVTAQENRLRGNWPSAVHARQTHCVNGHPFDEVNTWERKLQNGKKARVCRECRRVRLRKWYRRHHAKHT
jgi:hypothetical protein